MMLAHNIHIILLGLGLVQCVFVAVLLMSNYEPRSHFHHRYLAFFLLSSALSFLDGLAYYLQIHRIYPHLLLVSFPTIFLLGPFICFYVRELVYNQPYKLKGIQWLHFLTIIIALLLMLPFYNLPAPLKVSLLYGEDVTADNNMLVVLSLFCVETMLKIQTIVYLVLSLRLLAKHLDHIKQFFANIENKTLNWLRYILFALLFFWIAGFFNSMNNWFWKSGINIEIFTTFIDVIIIYLLSYLGFRQPMIFMGKTSKYFMQLSNSDLATTDSNLSGTNSISQKYVKSALDNESANRILSKLIMAMEEDHLYRSNTLTLRDLSDHTGVSPNYVSQVINEKLDRNFFDFVNNYRIEEAKRRLLAGERHISILNIALAVGFNSKSTFNAAFKRNTGQTPSQFKQSVLAKSVS